MKRILSTFALLVGVMLMAISLAYFLHPANDLPRFLPGYEQGVERVHYKHAAGSLLLGIGFLGFSFLRGSRK